MNQNLAIIPVKVFVTYHTPILEKDENELSEEEFRKQDPDGLSKQEREKLDQIDGIKANIDGNIPAHNGKVNITTKWEEGFLSVKELKNIRFVIKTYDNKRLQIVYNNTQNITIANEGNIYNELKAIATI